MSNKLNKEKRELEISLGLLVGYILAGTINMFAFDKSWKEAFSQTELIYAFVGIAISIIIIQKLKNR